MFEKHMICQDSLTNAYASANAQTPIGFSFLARLPYYRGLGLSMVEDVEIKLDGELVPRDHIRFSVRGHTWTLPEMEAEYAERWNFGEKATITVLRDGGLLPGEHVIELSERLRISYLPFVPTTRSKKTVTLHPVNPPEVL